jgi:hypothetical protein
MTVGAHHAAAVGPGLALQRGEPAAGLGDDDLQRGQVPQGHLGFGGDVAGALGDQHVRPEVPERAGPPHRPGQVEEVVQDPALGPSAQARVGHGCVAELGHPGHPAGRGLGQAAPGPRAAAQRAPPAAAERGRRHHSHHDVRAVHQPDQGGPDRNAPDVVLGPVDGVQDPAARPGAGPAEFLAEHRVARTRPAQHVAQRLFGRLVGIAHRREIGLGLHPQVERPEPPGGDVVSGVCEDMREAQVVVVADHPRNGTACDNSLATRPVPGAS